MFRTEQANLSIRNKSKWSSDHPLTNRNIEPLMNFNFFSVLIGKSGSGKTSLLINMLSDNSIYKKVFNKIICVMPEATYNNMEFNPFDVLPPEQIKHDFDCTELRAQINNYRDADKTTLLIIDDFTAELKNKTNFNNFNHLIQNRRHYRLSIFLLVQYYNSIPMPLRRSINTIFLFKCNKKEFEDIFAELFSLSKDLANKLQRFVFTNKYNFMLVNVTDQIYYRNYIWSVTFTNIKLLCLRRMISYCFIIFIYFI